MGTRLHLVAFQGQFGNRTKGSTVYFQSSGKSLKVKLKVAGVARVSHLTEVL